MKGKTICVKKIQRFLFFINFIKTYLNTPSEIKYCKKDSDSISIPLFSFVIVLNDCKNPNTLNKYDSYQCFYEIRILELFLK